MCRYMIANLQVLRELGAISVESIMERSDVIRDVDAERERIKAEGMSDKDR